MDEIVLGKLLGSGGFSDVYEIRAFRLNSSRDSRYTEPQRAARQFLKKSARRLAYGGSRYVIKFLQPSLIENTQRFEIAAADLANEADMMRAVNHPNILKMRGFAAGGVEAYGYSGRHDSYFLILDRLQHTLHDEIDNWERQAHRCKNILWEELLDKRGNKKRELLVERLRVAHGIASALEHMHGRGLIYRDLKPGNIGFDSHGEVKVFDLGLARSIPTDEGSLDGGYEMSGKAGTLRYMAPEVFLKLPYNSKADVYSFGHVLWEMLSFEKPYETYTRKQHREKVVFADKRPPIFKAWPLAVRELLADSWQPDKKKRPTMQQVRRTLEDEIVRLGGGEFPGMEAANRWSIQGKAAEEAVAKMLLPKEPAKNATIVQQPKMPKVERKSFTSRAA